MSKIFDFGFKEHRIKMDGEHFSGGYFAIMGDTARRLEVQLIAADNTVQDSTGLSLQLWADAGGKVSYVEGDLVEAAKGRYRFDLIDGLMLSPGPQDFQWRIIDESGRRLNSVKFKGKVGNNLEDDGWEKVHELYFNTGVLKQDVDSLKKLQRDLINGAVDSAAIQERAEERYADLEAEYAEDLSKLKRSDENITAQLERIANEPPDELPDDGGSNKPPLSIHYGLNVKDFGARGDGVTNDTEAIKDALRYKDEANLKTVYIPKGIYSVDAYEIGSSDTSNGQGNIRIPSNTELIMHPEATLKAIANNRKWYNLLTVQNVENVVIKGGKIQGERKAHIGNEGEWGHGIFLQHAKNVLIEDIDIYDCWGDGIDVQIGRWGEDEECRNVVIRNVRCDNNRRQGISLEGVIGCLIENSSFTNTNGTLPEAGIDIEPYDPINRVEDVEIRNCYIGDNAGGGIVIMGEGVKRIKIDFCTFEGNMSPEGQLPLFYTSDIIISHNTFVDGRMGGITQVDNVKVHNNNFKGDIGIINSSKNVSFFENYIKSTEQSIWQVIAIPKYRGVIESENIKFVDNKIHGMSSDDTLSRHAFNIAAGKDVLIKDNEIVGFARAIEVGVDVSALIIDGNHFINTGSYPVLTLSQAMVINNHFRGSCLYNPNGPLIDSISPLIVKDNYIFSNPFSDMDKQPRSTNVGKAEHVKEWLVNSGNVIIEN